MLRNVAIKLSLHTGSVTLGLGIDLNVVQWEKLNLCQKLLTVFNK